MRGACLSIGLLGLCACSGAGSDAGVKTGSAHGAVATLPQDAGSRELDMEWSSLAATLPAEADRLGSRVEVLRSEPKPAAAINPDAADALLRQATALFSKAQAAFAAGNLREAVGIAKTTQAQLDALAKTLKVPVAVPSATLPARNAP